MKSRVEKPNSDRQRKWLQGLKALASARADVSQKKHAGNQGAGALYNINLCSSMYL